MTQWRGGASRDAMPRGAWALWWMLAPAALVYVPFLVAPFLQTLWLSTRETSPFGLSSQSVGSDNYRRAFADPVFRRAVLNNAIYGGITLLSEIAVGLLLAVLIQRCRRGRNAYRVALATPLLIALVASAILWRSLLGYEGVLNTLLRTAGLDALAVNWLEPGRLVLAIGIMSGWAYCGFYMLLFDAALGRIGPELREAARLDGATGWQVFWHVERPLLRPVLVVAVLLCLTGAFRAFDLFYVMVGPSRMAEAEVAATWIVKSAFRFKELGYAAAMATLVALLLAGLSAVMLKVTARAREIEF